MSRSIIISNSVVSEIRDGKNTKPKKNHINHTNHTNHANQKNQKNQKRIKKRYKFLIFLLFLVIAFFGSLKYAEFRLQPIVKSMAVGTARSIGARVISEAITEEIDATNISYNDLISFEKDNSGNIAALKTDIIMINRLKSKLSVVILNKLSSIENININIPIGNLINGEFLAGRGPKLEIRILPVGSVSTDISNVFTSSGINQTRHQIMLDVRVTLTAIMTFATESTDISTSICIAETVIIGNVPDTYLQTGKNLFENPE